MDNKGKYNRYFNLTTAAVVVLVIVILALFVANLQPSRWLINTNLAYPELLPVAQGQMPLTTVIANAVSQGNIYRLPAELVSMLLGVALPASMVRYGYFSLLLLAGSLGIFFLTRYWLRNSKSLHADGAALTTAILYLGSVFTVQSIYGIDFAYITAAAAIPWLVLFAYLYCIKGKHHWLGLLVLTAFLSLEAGGNPFTGFAVIATPVVVGLYILAKRRTKSYRVINLSFLTVLTNLLWLTPLLYNLMRGVALALPQDATIDHHLPVVLQLFNSGNFSQASTITQFISDWGSHWQSAIIMPLVLIPIVFGVIAALWLLVSRKGARRAIAAFTLITTLLLILINIGIAIDSVPWQTIAGIKEILALAAGFGLALSASRLVNWLLSHYLHRLNRSAGLPFLIIGSACLLYVVLFFTPAFQNQLYPADSQAVLPESFTQLYTYFRDNATSGNILYINENLQQDPATFEASTSALPLDNYALRQPLITNGSDTYNNLIHIISSGNQDLITAALNRYQVDWVVVDASSLQADVHALTPELASLIANTTGLQKIDWIDAGHNELTFYKVARDTPTPQFAIADPALPQASPAIADYSIDATADLTINQTNETAENYLFRNLSTDHLNIDQQNKTIHFLTTLGANNYANLNLPALNKLNLENVQIQLSPNGNNLDILLQNAYPQIAVGGQALDPNLTSINLGNIAMPTSQFVLVLGNQIWGPFYPGKAQTIAVDKLALSADQNLRVYESYDLNDATNDFTQNVARNCITYDLIAGSTTTVTNGVINVSSPEDICLAADVPVIETDASALTITNFDYTSNVALRQCMFDKETSDCINKDQPTGISDGQAHHLQVIEELGKVGIRDLQTKFFFSKDANQTTRTVSLSNISIAEYKLTDSQTVTIPGWSTTQTLGVKTIGTIEAQIPFAAIQAADFNSGAFVDSFKTCGDSVQTVQVIPQADQHAIAINTADKLCVSHDYAELRSGRDHLLFLDYTLASGQTINTCIWDVSRNICLQNTTLSGNDTRQEALISVPRHGQDNDTYRVVFYTSGKLDSAFTISDISMLEANTDTLQGTYLSTDLPHLSAIAPADFQTTDLGYTLSIPANQTNSQLSLFMPSPNLASAWQLQPLSGKDPFSLLLAGGSSISQANPNLWQVNSGSYYLVNTNSAIAESILLLQAVALLILLVIPAGREVLVSGIMRSQNK